MRAKEPDFKDQFIGKKAENLEVTKTGASAVSHEIDSCICRVGDCLGSVRCTTDGFNLIICIRARSWYESQRTGFQGSVYRQES